MSEDFGHVKLDPDAEKAAAQKADGEKNVNFANGSSQDLDQELHRQRPWMGETAFQPHGGEGERRRKGR